jgi:hypothetical protein
MRTRDESRFRNFPALAALLAVGAAAAQGCGGDENPVPSPVVVGGSGGAGGNGGKGGKGGKGGTSATGGTGVGGEGGEGNEGSGAAAGAGDTGGTSGGGKGGTTATGGKTGSGGKGGSGSAGKGSGNAGKSGSGGTTTEIDCGERPDDCYRCEPAAIDPAPAFPHSPNEQFLNRCSDARAWPFDNATRIPNFPGTDNLPDLQ